MILSYTDIFNEDTKRTRIKATVTTNHCASSYGTPVIVLEDGGALDLMSWVAMGYQVERATKKEWEALENVFSNLGLLPDSFKGRRCRGYNCTQGERP